MSSYLLPQIVYTRDLHTHIIPTFIEKHNDATAATGTGVCNFANIQKTINLEYKFLI